MTPKYDIDKKTFAELKDKIEIPKFQRGLVWNRIKKVNFIKTLKEGLPIGVLLLSKKGDKYLIVDGLQRFTTMKDYVKDFFSYIDKSEITDIDLMSIVLASPDARAIFDEYTQEAKEKQFEFMRKILADTISRGHGKNLFQVSGEAAKELCMKIAAIPDKDYSDIQGAVFQITDRIVKQAQIDDVVIPLILFKGKEEELADIYQKLNQEGSRLTKYDVFAATWINHTVTVKNDPKFIDFIINKYEAAQKESELDIAAYDPDEMKQTGELTVFEYAFALGKALMDKCRRLFPKVDDAKVDSIGFLILAELMGLSYQDMGKLAETMVSFQNLDFKVLKDAILECAAIVENALCPYIDSPSKTSSGGRKASLVCHSELQLASYIIVVFNLKYSLTPQDGLVSRPKSKELPKVKEFLYKHYLFDILRGFWAGSGDNKLEEIIADPVTCRYTRDVAKADFEAAVSAWLADGNKKASLTNVSAETKLFLNYLLRTCGAYAEKTSYDVEHCVPKDVVKKYYLKKGTLVPLSPACNLVYIPSSDNRSKGEQTYYQRQACDPGTYRLNQEQLDTFGYPSRQELAFVESTSTLTEENYFAFLDNRREVILHKFITAMYP